MIYYLVIWCFSFFFSVITAGRKVKEKQVYVFFYWLIPIIIMMIGFRTDSVDYLSYLNIFESSDIKNFGFPLYDRLGTTTGNEFIFATIASLVNEVNLPFFILLLILALLSVGAKLYVITKYSPLWFISILLMLSYLSLKDFSQIRAAVSAAVLLISIPYCVDRSFKKFFLVWVLAVGFHIFAVLFLAFYFILPFLKKFSFVCLIFFVSLLFGYFSLIENFITEIASYLPGPLGGKVLGYYFNEARIKPEFGGWSLLHIFVTIILISFHKRFNEERMIYAKGFYFAYLFGVFLYFVFMGLPNFPGRSLDMFAIPSLLVAFPYALLYCRGVIRLVIFTFLSTYCLLSLVLHLHLLDGLELNFLNI